MMRETAGIIGHRDNDIVQFERGEIFLWDGIVAENCAYDVAGDDTGRVIVTVMVNGADNALLEVADVANDADTAMASVSSATQPYPSSRMASVSVLSDSARDNVFGCLHYFYYITDFQKVEFWLEKMSETGKVTRGLYSKARAY